MIFKIETAYDLRAAYNDKHPDGHFFDPDTLKFFGESMSQMRLLKNTVAVTDIGGDVHTCYVLSSRQRMPSGKSRRKYHYFDNVTLEDVIPA